MRSSWPWLVTFALVALTSTGCAKGVASMSVTQIAPAGLEPQDVVGVVVVNGTEAMEQKWAQRVSKCVDHVLDRARAKVRVMRASDTTPNVSSLPFDEDSAWQALAADAGFRQSAGMLGLQYLVAVSVSEYTGPSMSKAEFGRGGDVFGIDISSNRELTVNVKAVVVDLKNARLAARVSGGGRGNSRQGMILLYLVIPIPYWSTTSSFDPACRKLGMGVALALVHRTSDPEVVSACPFVDFVKDDNWDDMVEKVLRLRGNTVLFPEDASASIYAEKFWRDVRARVYRCETRKSP